MGDAVLRTPGRPPRLQWPLHLDAWTLMQSGPHDVGPGPTQHWCSQVRHNVSDGDSPSRTPVRLWDLDEALNSVV